MATLTPPAALTNFANETGGNLAAAKVDLDTLVTRIPVQGQALAAASVPVVLTAAQVTSLTPPTTVTVTQATGTNLHAVVDSITLPATPAGTNVIGKVGIDQTTPGTTNAVSASGTLSNNGAAPTSNEVGVLPALANTADPTYTDGNQVLLSVDTGGNLRTKSLQSGAWNVGASSATGSAVPANAFSMGLSDGTNLQAMRSNYNTTTGDAGAKTVTFNGATQTNYNQQSAYIYVLCGTVSGTAPTMAAQLQWSPDGGTTWVNLGPATGTITATGNSLLIAVGPENWSQAAGATPANLTTGATAKVAINAPLPRTWRLAYTIGGTTPSFAIAAVYVNYQGV